MNFKKFNIISKLNELMLMYFQTFRSVFIIKTKIRIFCNVVKKIKRLNLKFSLRIVFYHIVMCDFVKLKYFNIEKLNNMCKMCKKFEKNNIVNFD